MYLNLQHNDIYINPVEISKGFISLHRLDLRHTKVTKLPTSMLHFEVILGRNDSENYVISQEHKRKLDYRIQRKKC